jgi:hypothetical protein
MPANSQSKNSVPKGAKAPASKPLPPIQKSASAITVQKKKGCDSDFAELDTLFRCF